MRAVLMAFVLAACSGSSSGPPSGPTLPPPAAPPAAPTDVAKADPPPKKEPPKPALPPDPEPWRNQRPAAGPPVSFTPPKIVQTKLENGIPVYVVENRAVPLVAVQVIVRAGSSADPQDQHGVAAFTANLMDEGAGKLGALAIAEKKDALGTNLVTSAAPDYSTALVDTLTENLGASLDLLADVVVRPRFEQAEVERVRNEVLNDLRQIKDSGPRSAQNVLVAKAYGAAHPYGHLPAGTKEGVEKLGPEQVKAFHAAHWRPENAAIVVVGDVTAKAVTAELQKRFGAWKGVGDVKKLAPSEGAPVAKSRVVYLVDRPGAQQGDVLIGAPALSRLDPDWITVEVMNRVLGGSFYSRINLNLREDKGATYGARSGFTSAIGPGLFTAGGGMVLDKTILAINETLKEIEGLSSRPATEEELRRARDAATLGLAARFETNASIAGAVAEIVVFGLPLDYYETYVARVQAVDATAVTAAAKKWLAGAAAHVVVVGPAATLEKDLAKVGKVVRVDAYGASSK